MKTAALGMQHVLAMYAGAILVPLIIGGALGLTTEQLTYLVAIDIFMCGVATLLQIVSNRFFGIGLPVVLGCTFTAVGPIIAIGGEFGISAIYGSIIASGIFIILISTIFGKLVRFFPPIVTGSVVTIIGLTLIPVAINNLAGGQGASDFGSSTNLLLGFGTLTFIILMYRFSKGFVRSISIIIGLFAGTLVAAVLGKVNFSAVAEASYFHMPQLFYFGMPTFEISAVITMCLVAMVSLVESTGVYFALGDITDRKLSENDLAKGYRAEGIAVLLGGIFNAFQYTAFSQNVGLVQLTGVKKRSVILVAGIILIIFGLVPKIAALTTIIPTAVLGGAMLAMFGMVVSQGIKMLGKVISESPENSMIIACSVGMGLGVTVVPDLFSVLPTGIQILTNNGIVAGSVTAIVLNMIFNMRPFTSKRSSPQAVQQMAEQEAL
ncbi:nucleobase:cation symporter-2 family protein [Oceanobacillus alkalisoli]|uniref:nucleobase:cation symporter-2 family protein n=1 Tax=Oceanobacillus alkalisoli TaxID=2925113 RepID=UPI001EE4E1F7|nr:nucleobase:cation symporter-2 family protein [Oceanobacillus alkalisoli]MCG5103235.1 purine permease [Oceanobacillus alkalisoli]